jgi:hypothetical protein
VLLAGCLGSGAVPFKESDGRLGSWGRQSDRLMLEEWKGGGERIAGRPLPGTRGLVWAEFGQDSDAENRLALRVLLRGESAAF